MRLAYEHAPVTEALIDIRIQALAPHMISAIETIHERIRDSYPEKVQRFKGEFTFTLGDESNAAARRTPEGFIFRSGDGKQVFQARLDGFALSRLRPYTNWDKLQEEAERLWVLYRGIVGALETIRVAVRYINQIDIPVAEIDYKDYFRTTPEISPLLPQGLSDFFMRLSIPQPQFGGTVILTQASTAPPDTKTTSVILDIDVFSDQVNFHDDREIWRVLETLRECKNQFFEGSLTEKAKALFGEKAAY